MAVAEHLGAIGEPIVSIALVLFATTTIAYNSFLGENSIAYFGKAGGRPVLIFRVSVLALIAWASVQDLSTVFGFADLTMALLALVNLVGAMGSLSCCDEVECLNLKNRLRRVSLPDLVSTSFPIRRWM